MLSAMTTPTPVPFNDLSRTPADVASQIRAAIDDVIASGWFVMGPQHRALEEELSAYLGVRDTVLVANGTDALELALAAVGVGQGDLVVTAANAGAYTTIAARLLGAVPAYADIEDATLLMSARTFEAALATLPTAPKAVVVTHLYGALAPVADIVEVARRHGIAVVEDCAQSIGARANGRHGGTFGDVATTSFYPTKNLGALGDGGAVFTDDPAIAESVRRMRQYGWGSKYNIKHSHGKNSRMDELQAAILRVKLPYLDAWNARRREIHEVYETAAPATARLVNKATEAFTAHLAVLVVNDREGARTQLKAAGIGNEVHYPIPDHRQSFPDSPPSAVDLPVTEWATERVLSIPLFPELTDAEVDRVRDALDGL
jgi:aminotransferase EvaB